MWQANIPLPSLPIMLVCSADATIEFNRTGDFNTILDSPEDSKKVKAIFAKDGFTIGSESYEYGEPYSYKEIPEMLQYLKEKEMDFPKFNAGF